MKRDPNLPGLFDKLGLPRNNTDMNNDPDFPPAFFRRFFYATIAASVLTVAAFVFVALYAITALKGCVVTGGGGAAPVAIEHKDK